ncbi:hypothetical protein [Parasitella parasitica]|uniref:Uncharacterized protein n=1 Tax=Parasitella parasitica TaxID=35722 RepID=A0A0B7NFH5_9FUNG|nr:hypothetical protein [Parasitella parasitica]
MSRNNKYHVTIEDCPDEDDHQQFNQNYSDMDDIDLGHINSNQENGNVDVDSFSTSRGSKTQAWDQVDALEEQARTEKMQNQSTAMANARQTAHIVEVAAQQSSGH